jgi:hypothetical protein
MATYVPAALVALTSHSSVSTTWTYTASSAATTAVIRTIAANCTVSAGLSVTVALGGADAAGRRLIDAYVLTQAVPAIFNGWWAQPFTAASQVGMLTSADGLSKVTGSINGYAYT